MNFPCSRQVESVINNHGKITSQAPCHVSVATSKLRIARRNTTTGHSYPAQLNLHLIQHTLRLTQAIVIKAKLWFGARGSVRALLRHPWPQHQATHTGQDRNLCHPTTRRRPLPDTTPSPVASSPSAICAAASFILSARLPSPLAPAARAAQPPPLGSPQLDGPLLSTPHRLLRTADSPATIDCLLCHHVPLVFPPRHRHCTRAVAIPHH